MNSNQALLDRTLRHKILLLGFSKQVADEVIAYLKRTQPAIRKLLLEQFAFKVTGSRLLTRLRQTEARLRAIRKDAWLEAREMARRRMGALAEAEPDELDRATGELLSRPEQSKFPLGLVASTLIAGHTLDEWFDSLETGDGQRLIANLRIGALAGEDVLKLMRRLTGRNAMATGPLLQQIQAVTASAAGSIADAVRYAIVGQNSHLFDYEIWISILDNRTTQGCRNLHLKKFPVGEGPTPGYHMHCRSERVPFHGDGGNVLAEDYGSWIETQPDSFRRYAGDNFSYANLKPIGLKKT